MSLKKSVSWDTSLFQDEIKGSPFTRKPVINCYIASFQQISPYNNKEIREITRLKWHTENSWQERRKFLAPSIRNFISKRCLLVLFFKTQCARRIV
jgi:hypothetical protein